MSVFICIVWFYSVYNDFTFGLIVVIFFHIVVDANCPDPWIRSRCTLATSWGYKSMSKLSKSLEIKQRQGWWYQVKFEKILWLKYLLQFLKECCAERLFLCKLKKYLQVSSIQIHTLQLLQNFIPYLVKIPMK